MPREIDARPILGNRGTITLLENNGGVLPRYIVDVRNSEGESVWMIGVDTTAEALDAFNHPFARPEVPDVFRWDACSG